MSMKTVELSCGNVAVRDEGAGSVLLFVHGFPLDQSMWDNQVELLSDRYRVITFDLPGFGQSAARLPETSMAAFADVCADLLDRLSITEPVVLCGLSMGGYIAWEFWRRHASRLSALVLCNTRAAADSDEVRRGRSIMAEKVVREGTAFVASAMVPKLFAPNSLRDAADVVEQVRRVILGTDPEVIADTQRGMAARADGNDVLGEIDRPALLVGGDADVITPAEEMRSVAAAMPQAQFVEIAAAGHLSPLEQPEDFQRAMERFLARLREE